MKVIGRLNPLGLLLVWSMSTTGWLLLYGFSFDIRDAALQSPGEMAPRVVVAAIAIMLALLPILLLSLTFVWLRTEGLAERVAGWHLGQLAAAWFVGGFLVVFVSLGFRQLGATSETAGLVYLLLFLGFTSLAVPALLTARWLSSRGEAEL